MHINRKTGELVEAEWVEKVSAWNVKDGFGITIALLSTATFNAQYSEAMICPKKFSDSDMKKCNYCPLTKPHICQAERNTDKDFDCPACIPYIPEEYDVDNEPVFPICGTCNYIKDKNLEQSNLMLSDDEIGEIADKSSDDTECPMAFECAELVTAVRMGTKAELDHLKGLGIMYVKVKRYPKYIQISRGYEYIPLSDYKGEKQL